MAIPDVGVFLNATDIPDTEAACAAVQELGFRSIQFGKLPDDDYTPAGAARLATYLEKYDLRAVALCIVFDGESYADIQAVHDTVGFLPPQSVAARVSYSQRCLETAAALRIPLVTTHVGLLPADPRDPAYWRAQAATHEVAAHAQRCRVQFAIETGQETATELLDFIARLDAPVGVNFDGANFVAYGTQAPLDALPLLYPKILGVHVKDCTPPLAAGRLGNACPLGQGAAHVDETLRFLQSAGFPGPVILETYSDVDPLLTLSSSRAYVLERLQAMV